MSIVDTVHERVHRVVVFNRRRDRLVDAIDAYVPSSASVLDIGCGNGEVGRRLTTVDREVYGLETQERAQCSIPLTVYDGSRLPFADDSFEWAIVIDVLHHSADPDRVIAEARRVARAGVVVKDHYAETAGQRFRLGVMDWVGNRQFGVGRDGHYLTRAEWARLWERQELAVTALNEAIDLYPAAVKLFFENGLHFVARLEPRIQT
jgi:SAM-dependent methyltransferase